MCLLDSFNMGKPYYYSAESGMNLPRVWVKITVID